MSETVNRSTYWDNVRAVLIFLVVLGHFLLVIRNDSRSISAVYYWIYLFHMPAFVFVSGMFSKSYVKKKNKSRRIFGLILLYLFFIFTEWVINSIFKSGGVASFSLFSTNSAPWYLLAMIIWFIVIPYFAKSDKKILLLAGATVLGLLIGLDPQAGSFLALSRVIVFFPFFLAGYYFSTEPVRIRKMIRLPAAVILAAVLAVLYFCSDKLSPYLQFIYADRSYQALGFEDALLTAVCLRLLFYIAAVVMMFSLFVLIPERKLFFTYLGERTLAIYIFHRLVRDIFKHLGLYEFGGHGITLLIYCLLVSAFVTWITSAGFLNRFLRKAFDILPAGNRTDAPPGTPGSEG